MTAGLVVRRAVEADAPLIAQMIDELNRHQGEETGHVTAEAVRRDGFGARPEFGVLIAELDGKPAGYALFHPTWSTEVGERGFYLYDLYVRDSARGHGVGRALMRALARAAKEEGRTFLWWNSKAWNEEARAFYRTLGGIEEEVRAHALFGEAFERLAEG
ncbi:N-acetyltransferase family protein [Benzoatithermus flavus]|uniref:GNAT family N-acetyltransferase n=1 Tax=Benzoatithermus flavus TaxID=3108223 RepID=A0ABU8XUD8_9PROT